ncbi:MAG: GxxExxY protein [Planctomycetaceae bacterium]|nr:GxxExxY protein [Planctomycetaceae bacterium]
MTEILFPDESYAIMGACFEVHNQLGSGFVEPVYQEALEIEFRLRGIRFVSQQELVIEYKSHRLEQTYKPDFVCFERIIVEIKAVNEFHDRHRAQLHNYLKATGIQLGLLVNFSGHPKLEYERIARTVERNREQRVNCE